MEFVDFVTVDDRVPRIGTSGKPDHEIGFFREEINDLPLPFIAPLGSDNNDIQCGILRFPNFSSSSEILG